MQQVIQSAQDGAPVSGKQLPRPSSHGAFVVNLGSSSTPVALNEPRQPELKGFTFFISRRREDGRERFRLHMGYFASQQEAESMLEVVRDIYPGAWAGIAPGRKPPDYVPVPVTEISATPSPPPARAPAPAAAAAPALASTSAPVPVVAASAPAHRAVPPSTDGTPLTLKAESEPAPPKKSTDEHFAATQSLDSVRAAIASLDDSRGIPALSATQTLKLLEAPPADVPTLSAAPPSQTPRAAAPERVQSPTLNPEAIAAYAVQLRWATQPIGLSELPPLAIFDAYTLYRAKGRHESSHWHALRLGFFNDLVSAEQVASYIRPEFAEATVVPVGAAEREKARSAAARTPASAPSAAAVRAKGAPAAATGASGPAPKPTTDATGQFRLIDDSGVKAADHSRLEMMLTADAEAPAATGATAGKPAQKTRRPPANLEETLDVLGAGSLKLDGAKGEMLDASGVRRMRHAAERKTPGRSSLSKLFDRLSERIGGGR